MKARLQAALVASSAVLLASCASGDGMMRPAPEADFGAQPHQASDKVVRDMAYMARVEQQALSRGVMVHWVNLPTKRVPMDYQASAAR